MHRGTHNTEARKGNTEHTEAHITQRHAKATQNTQRHTNSKAFNKGT